MGLSWRFGASHFFIGLSASIADVLVHRGTCLLMRRPQSSSRQIGLRPRSDSLCIWPT
jgi:hypothetical protein